MAFAKGVNSGYVPLGGVLVGDAIYDTFVERPYPGGLTYAGHPLACAASVGTLRVMHEGGGLVASAARLGRDVLEPGLGVLAEQTRRSVRYGASARSGGSSSSATAQRGNRSRGTSRRLNLQCVHSVNQAGTAGTDGRESRIGGTRGLSLVSVEPDGPVGASVDAVVTEGLP